MEKSREIGEPLRILQQYWGYSHFRESQEEIISEVMAGRDTLALLPTGGGKSICYQVPTLAMDGLCIVVSPLLALMADQVDSLVSRGIKAVAISSMLRHREVDRLLDNCIYGDTRFLFVSPERLENGLFIERLKKMKPVLFAIDEAHCISQWGYDFRPAYLNIAKIREHHPNVPVLALTATATPQVVVDIQEKLEFRTPNVVSRSFARENIRFSVNFSEDKRSHVVRLFEQHQEGSGILYVRNRRLCMDLSASLRRRGIKSGFYNAGMSKEDRKLSQEKWMDGRSRVMVATNAFGMGIDKPNVRTVVHYGLCDCLEAYYQEAGRAGRDGEVSRAVMVYDHADLDDALYRIKLQYPSLEIIRTIYQALADNFQLAIGSGQDETFGLSMGNMSDELELPMLSILGGIRILEMNGLVHLSEGLRTPTRLQLTCDRQEIQRVMETKGPMRSLLSVLLRSYTGLFNSPMDIKEEDLARRMNTTALEVKSLLKQLVAMDMAIMEERKGDATLTFLLPRKPSSDLYIDPKLTRDQRDRQWNRQVEMIRYVRNIYACRSVTLLEYFGEKDPPDCGQCDVCIARQNLAVTASQFHGLLKDISTVLKTEAMEIHPLSARLGADKEALKQALTWMIDNGYIRLRSRNLEWIKRT